MFFFALDRYHMREAYGVQGPAAGPVNAPGYGQWEKWHYKEPFPASQSQFSGHSNSRSDEYIVSKNRDMYDEPDVTFLYTVRDTTWLTADVRHLAKCRS